MSSFGAGDLGSYMGGGGGNETPTQSSYSGNMQIIFLLLAGGVVMMFMVLNILGGGPGGLGATDKTIPEEEPIPGIEYHNPQEAEDLLDGIDLSKYGIDEEDYVPQQALTDASIVDSLAEMKVWKACGDSDLVLKLLELHSFSDAELYADDDDDDD